MNRDGRDSDDADWLLAQLAAGGSSVDEEPPVAAPSEGSVPHAGSVLPEAVVLPEGVVLPEAAAPSPLPLPRTEEVLDWFTMAESPVAPDAATRALPVIGAPSAVDPLVSSAVEAPAEPPRPPAASHQVPTSSPEWSPPFIVGRPAAPAAPIVPPGPATVGQPPAPVAPIVPPGPSAVGRPPAPAAPIVPPGPATPPAPFALTWGSDELNSEDAIRAAFRRLSGGQPAPDEAPADTGPDTGPALARQSFTPVTDATPGIPRHPIAPATAPAGWDERPTAAAATPTPTPRPDFDGELWSALTDDEPAAVNEPTVSGISAAPTAATAMDAAVASDPLPPTRARTGVTPGAPGGAAPSSLPTEQEREDHHGFPYIEVRGDAGPGSLATAGATAAASAAESVTNRRAPFPAFAAARGDDPFGRSDDQGAEPVDDLLAALGSGSRRPSDGDTRGGGSGAGRSDGAGGTPPSDGTPPSGGTGYDPFRDGFDDENGADDDGPVDDDRADDDRADNAAGVDRADEGGFDDGLGALGLTFDDGDDEPAKAPEAESPIAREIAETGYFWNLTPDPTAHDPKADPSVAGGASTVPSPFGPPSPFAVGGDETTQFEAEPEPEPAVPEPAWPFEPPTTAFEPPATVFEPPATPFDPAPPTPLEPNAHGATDSAHTDPLAALFGTSSEPVGATPPQARPTPAGSPFPADGAFAGAATGAAIAGASAPASRSSASTAPRSGGAGGAGRGASTGSSGGSGSGGSRTTRTLLWIAAGLVVCVVLVGLFYVGTLLSAGGGDAAGPSAAPVETETPVAEPTAPQPVGVHAWNTLFGGECIEPFASVWEEEFTVADCAAPHAAQLVYRGELVGDAAAPFPGEAEVATQATAMCTADGVIDVGLVAGIPDLQVQAAFPANEEQWAEGERTVYCFANRTGGEPLTGSIAGPGPTA